MKKYCIVLVLLYIVFLAGCSHPSEYDFSDELQTASTEPTASITTEDASLPPFHSQPTDNPDLLHTESGTFLDRITQDWLTVEFYTYVPKNATKNMPLILFLHGDGEIGKTYALEHIALVDNAIEIYGEEFPFIAIAPCRAQKSWCTGQMPSTLLSLIEQIADKYNCDRNRIIITGFSSGAMGTWYMISNHTETFSAAVPISCPNEYPILYQNIVNIPIWGFVGEKEYSYTQSMSEIINWTAKIGGDARLTVMEGMSHPGMDKASYTQDVIEWMIAQ